MLSVLKFYSMLEKKFKNKTLAWTAVTHEIRSRRPKSKNSPPTNEACRQ
jgi:hypothetical protein